MKGKPIGFGEKRQVQLSCGDGVNTMEFEANRTSQNSDRFTAKKLKKQLDCSNL